MSIYITILIYVSCGLIAGVFGGLGMGGGTLLIPLLTIFLGLDQKMCQGINLVSFLVMALFSLIIHQKNNFIKLKGTPYIILVGVIFSVCGALIAGYLPSKILKIAFGFFLCILSIIEVIKVLKK